MSTLRIDILDPRGAYTTQLVSGERILVGCASHCDVLLPVEFAAPEHALIEVVADSIRITSRAEPAVCIDGSPVVDGVVKPESRVGLGALTLQISATTAAGAHGTKATSASRRSSMGVRVALVAAILASAFVLLKVRKPVGPAPNSVPELWSSATAACSTRDPKEAAQTAFTKQIVASAKRERHPFHLADGVEAVELFEVSAACLVVAGDPQGAKEITEMATELREEIDDDYRVRRLRLEYALRRNDESTVDSEVALLRELLRGKKGDYVTWLDSLGRSVKPQPKKKAIL